MNFAASFLLFCITLSFYITKGTASSMQCHVCNSHSDENCATITDDRYLKNCSEERGGHESKGCRKLEQWIDKKILELEPEQRIIRQCDAKSEEGKDKGCIYRTGFGSRRNDCHCYEAGCNGASTISIISLSFIAFSFLCGRLFF